MAVIPNHESMNSSRINDEKSWYKNGWGPLIYETLTGEIQYFSTRQQRTRVVEDVLVSLQFPQVYQCCVHLSK